MDILIVTPAAKDSLSGNRATANRWRKIFHNLGHNVTVVNEYQNQSADVMVAIHAWRSAEAIQKFKSSQPNSALIVVLSGTDAYRFLHSHSQVTLNSLELADRLIGLHSKIHKAIPEQYHNKISVIYQSAQFLPRQNIQDNKFLVCVAGHLREEKDPLRVAYAVRHLPNYSNIEVHHYGKAHSHQWAYKARLEEARNSRYQWHGEVSQGLLKSKMQRSHLLVLPSIMEGGANIISEALAMELPVIASRIDGSEGLLGQQYPGFFETGNTQQLYQLLLKAESDSRYYQRLSKACRKRRSLFHSSKETLDWKNILEEICY